MSTPTAKAVLLIGGPSKGTRMRPLSLDLPKPLFPIAGRPIIWHNLQALSKVQGLVEVFLVGFFDDAVFAQFIKDASRDFPNLQIRYMREYQALGTAGGLYHFRDTILKGNPDQIFVLHADIACSFPLTEIQAFHDRHRGVGTVMGVKVPKETANRYGCIVIDPETSQARHFVEKPEGFISDLINGGIYLFDKSIFDEIRQAMDDKQKREADEPMATPDEELRLEQDVIAPLASAKKLFVYQSLSSWVQIKTPASAIPANALTLASYKTTNPTLLRRRSPTILAKSRSDVKASKKKGPEIIEPCFIDETAEVDESAKIGPNVSIGANVKAGFGVRIKNAIVLENTVIDKNACVQHAIVGEDCKLGPWSRVEGSPSDKDDKLAIAILGKDVTVLGEVHVRSCIVLPHKNLSRNSHKEILL